MLSANGGPSKDSNAVPARTCCHRTLGYLWTSFVTKVIRTCTDESLCMPVIGMCPDQSRTITERDDLR